MLSFGSLLSHNYRFCGFQQIKILEWDDKLQRNKQTKNKKKTKQTKFNSTRFADSSRNILGSFLVKNVAIFRHDKLDC